MAKAEMDLQNYVEMLRIQREEQQYAMHMGTRSTNINAYQIEKQTEVGIAGANALGQMGQNGVGDINLGGGAAFNPMSMMAGMAVGSVVGQNLAGTVNNAMHAVNNIQVIPPIPTITYHIAKDGKDLGAFEINKIKEMISSGELTKNNFVWKQGLSTWVKACEIEELKDLFPPEIPL